MELLWLGHAGIVVRHGSTMVAVDPFLSGKFWWKGRLEQYQGESPWIGEAGRQQFLEKYGSQLTAICITHAHGDHCDLDTIFQLLQTNPKIWLFIPHPIHSWLKSMDNCELAGIIKVRAGKDYDLPASNVIIHPIQDPKSRFERYPSRVGYLIRPINSPGVAHVGDSHSIGSDWGAIKDMVSDLVIWQRGNPTKIVRLFNHNRTLKRVWAIHWEPFHPGNFDCNKDPIPFLSQFQPFGIQTGKLSYEKWTEIR
jgi:L-ascorbate metabolism protein UlaG (beta-lactamase superfamily)